MIYTEWDMETALDVRYDNGYENGREEGREEGIEIRNAEVARNALMKGLSIDVIHDITGLNMDTIRNLQLGASN